MGADNEPGGHPWLRSTPVVLWAGGIGLALIAVLVFTVVQMSDEWSKPITTVLTTTAPSVAPEASTSSDRTPLIVTPSSTSSSFTTSVSVSTTDIGGPPPIETTSGTESAPSTAPSPGFTAPTFPSQGRPATEPDDEPTSTRKRPRLNETRSLTPRP